MPPTLKATKGLIEREGIGGAKLGEHPITIWLITAIVIVYLYIRRSNLGIDKHPTEQKAIIKPATPLPTVTIPTMGGEPYTPPTQPKLWRLPLEKPSPANSPNISG